MPALHRGTSATSGCAISVKAVAWKKTFYFATLCAETKKFIRHTFLNKLLHAVSEWRGDVFACARRYQTVAAVARVQNPDLLDQKRKVPTQTNRLRWWNTGGRSA